MNGILLVNKPAGITSRDVVNKAGKILGTKKVGHTGTLDPLATGVLVLCVGSATKLVEILTATEKEYVAEMILGIKTDTYDITGNILEDNKIIKSEEEIRNVLMSMQGTYEQEVPIYSAVKIDGKKLYEYARENKSIELPKRMVTISKIELLNIEEEAEHTKFSFLCKVSKGTYIRSLVCDIANKLSTVGSMTKLNRVKQGDFSLEQCYTLEDIEQGNFQLLDIKDCLNKFPKVIADGKLLNAIKNGSIVTNRWAKDEILFTDKNDSIIALYKKYDKDESMLKPWKMF